MYTWRGHPRLLLVRGSGVARAQYLEGEVRSVYLCTVSEDDVRTRHKVLVGFRGDIQWEDPFLPRAPRVRVGELIKRIGYRSAR